MDLSKFFVDWFKTGGREFPWRKPDVTPFNILVTEMLLRQTRAQQVANLWTSLRDRYPTAVELSLAKRSVLSKKIQSLGFGRMRAEALVSSAKWLMKVHHGNVPANREELISIPHIGSYSANAVLCFAFGQKIEVVDGNVLRFLSRFYGVAVKPDIRRNPQIIDLARKMLPTRKRNATSHNYGLLDFTAMICRPVGPKCSICPLSGKCEFGRFSQLGN